MLRLAPLFLVVVVLISGASYGETACHGTCDPCSVLNGSPALCNVHAGCSVDSACTGSCTSCSPLAEASCSNVFGCAWQAATGCEGTCTVCELLDMATCELSSDGCKLNNNPKCTGTCTPCSALVGQSSCEAQEDCVWNSGLSTCSGTCRVCASYNGMGNSNTCVEQAGCVEEWCKSTGGGCGSCASRSDPECLLNPGCSLGSAQCTGTCTACSTLSGGECSAQPGCSEITSCLGTCTPCSSLGTVESVCLAQSGCFFCGDGNVDPGEQCDDGNQASGDGCSSSCVTETCSDGIKNNFETDVDCGGSVCAARCAAGSMCVASADCSNSCCHLGTCTGLSLPTISTQADRCGQGNGAIQLNAIGGGSGAPYTCHFGGVSSVVASGGSCSTGAILNGGQSITVSVSDQAGCSVSLGSVLVPTDSSSCAPECMAFAASSRVTSSSCSAPTGSFVLSDIAGASGPYTCALQGGPTVQASGGSCSFTSLPVGPVQVLLSSSNGCILSFSSVISLADTDSDGVNDCVDQCPLDSSKTQPGLCGCGVSDASGCSSCSGDECGGEVVVVGGGGSPSPPPPDSSGSGSGSTSSNDGGDNGTAAPPPPPSPPPPPAAPQILLGFDSSPSHWMQVGGDDLSTAERMTVVFRSVDELDPSGAVVRSAPVYNTTGWSRQVGTRAITNTTTATSVRYYRTLPSGSFIELLNLFFDEDALLPSFGDTVYVITAPSNKFTLTVRDWPFASADNVLRLTVDFSAASGIHSVISNSETTTELVRSLETNNQYALSVSLAREALVDGVLMSVAGASFESNSVFWVELPSFTTEVTYDPNLALLFFDSTDNEETDMLWVYLAAGLMGGLLIAGIVFTLLASYWKPMRDVVMGQEGSRVFALRQMSHGSKSPLISSHPMLRNSATGSRTSELQQTDSCTSVSALTADPSNLSVASMADVHAHPLAAGDRSSRRLSTRASALITSGSGQNLADRSRSTTTSEAWVRLATSPSRDSTVQDVYVDRVRESIRRQQCDQVVLDVDVDDLPHPI
mmetsp:Transcript_15303/g.38981  ORF Transcript_15303/g.38981 Transcript_15303/m.38981 type:complete len:1028 (+) Transcript_15303:199-3282(+)